MEHSATAPSRKAIEAALASARALVATLEAALMDADDGPELLDMKATAERGAGQDALKAAALRGELDAAERGRGVPLRITAKSLHACLERMGA